MADADAPPQTFTVRPVYRFPDGTEHTARLELAQPSMDAVHAFGTQHGGEFVGFADPSDASREVVPSQPTAPTAAPQAEGMLRRLAPTAAQMLTTGVLGATGVGAPIAIPAGIAASAAADALLPGQGSLVRGAGEGAINEVGGRVLGKVAKGLYRGARALAPGATGALERGVSGAAERVFGTGARQAAARVADVVPQSSPTIVTPPQPPVQGVPKLGNIDDLFYANVNKVYGAPRAPLPPSTSGPVPAGNPLTALRAGPTAEDLLFSSVNQGPEYAASRWIAHVGGDPKQFVAAFNKLSPEQATTLFGPDRAAAFSDLNTVLTNAIAKTEKHPGDLLQAALGIAGGIFGHTVGFPTSSRALGAGLAAVPIARGAQQKLFSQLLSSPAGIRLLASSVDAAASGVGEVGQTLGRAGAGAAQAGLFSPKTPPPLLPDHHIRRQ